MNLSTETEIGRHNWTLLTTIFNLNVIAQSDLHRIAEETVAAFNLPSEYAHRLVENVEKKLERIDKTIKNSAFL